MQTVSVPQKDGEIVVSRSGDPPVTYPVKNGSVQMEDENVDGFLRQVQGAQLVPAAPAQPKP